MRLALSPPMAHQVSETKGRASAFSTMCAFCFRVLSLLPPPHCRPLFSTVLEPFFHGASGELYMRLSMVQPLPLNFFAEGGGAGGGSGR